MSLRPDFTVGPRRERAAGELGLVDPRSAPAFTLDATPTTGRYSLQTAITGSPLQYAQSDVPMRDIMGDEAAEQFSFSLWAKADSAVAASDQVAGFGPDSQSSSVGFGFDFIQPTSGLFWIFTRTTVANRSMAPVSDPTVWNHYCGTYNRSDGSGATIRLFVNGSNAGATNGTHSTARNFEADTHLVVGRGFFRAVAATNHWDGNLCWLQVWNRQLTSGEVSSLYNSGTPLRVLTPGLASGLRLFWKLGDSYEERQRALQVPPGPHSVIDSSGNGFHGRLRSDHVTAPSYPTYVLDAP